MQNVESNNRIEIHSKDNRTVKLAASLAEKKHRDALGAYLIEGPNLVREALQQGVEIKFIFTGAGALRQQEIEEILPLADKSGSAVCVLSEDCFAKVSATSNSQGIAAMAVKRSWSEGDLFAPGSNVLVCDRIQDPAIWERCSAPRKRPALPVLFWSKAGQIHTGRKPCGQAPDASSDFRCCFAAVPRTPWRSLQSSGKRS